MNQGNEVEKWVVTDLKSQGRIIIENQNEEVICFVDDFNTSMMQQRAQLIASAPQLAADNKRMREAIEKIKVICKDQNHRAIRKAIDIQTILDILNSTPPLPAGWEEV